MRGWIVLNNSAGRALRCAPADVSVRDVLDCTGDFAAGDVIYVTFRGADGGQFVIATGVAGCAEPELRKQQQAGDPAVVVRGRDIKLLW